MHLDYVGQLPDAEYTLVLEVTDKAGNTFQTAVTVSTINSFVLMTYVGASAGAAAVAVLVILFYFKIRSSPRRETAS